MRSWNGLESITHRIENLYLPHHVMVSVHHTVVSIHLLLENLSESTLVPRQQWGPVLFHQLPAIVSAGWTQAVPVEAYTCDSSSTVPACHSVPRVHTSNHGVVPVCMSLPRVHTSNHWCHSLASTPQTTEVFLSTQVKPLFQYSKNVLCYYSNNKLCTLQSLSSSLLLS